MDIVRTKSYRELSEADKWRRKITKYYATWATRWMRKLVHEKMTLKSINMATVSSWGHDCSTCTVRVEKLPLTSSFLGAKQFKGYVETIYNYLGSSNREVRLLGVEHIFFSLSGQHPTISTWTEYKGVLSSRGGGVFMWHDSSVTPYNEIEIKEHLDLAAMLLEQEITNYDLEVELKLEIPFLK